MQGFVNKYFGAQILDPPRVTTEALSEHNG
jgi:hypothetical protein